MMLVGGDVGGRVGGWVGLGRGERGLLKTYGPSAGKARNCFNHPPLGVCTSLEGKKKHNDE